MRYLGEDRYSMNNGKEFYANCGIIGLSPKECHYENDWYIHEGYDGGIFESREFTKEERKEISDFMINQWREWSKQ